MDELVKIKINIPISDDECCIYKKIRDILKKKLGTDNFTIESVKFIKG